MHAHSSSKPKMDNELMDGKAHIYMVLTASCIYATNRLTHACMHGPGILHPFMVKPNSSLHAFRQTHAHLHSGRLIDNPFKILVNPLH